MSIKIWGEVGNAASLKVGRKSFFCLMSHWSGAHGAHMALNFIVCGVGKVQIMKAQISRRLAMATGSLSSHWHEPKPGGWGERNSEIKGTVKVEAKQGNPMTGKLGRDGYRGKRCNEKELILPDHTLSLTAFVSFALFIFFCC